MYIYMYMVFRVSVNLGVMTMKRYFTFPKASELEPHHQMI